MRQTKIFNSFSVFPKTKQWHSDFPKLLLQTETNLKAKKIKLDFSICKFLSNLEQNTQRFKLCTHPAVHKLSGSPTEIIVQARPQRVWASGPLDDKRLYEPMSLGACPGRIAIFVPRDAELAD